MSHFAWDFQESVVNYCQIYTESKEGSLIVSDFIWLNVTSTPENDRIIQSIVEKLNELTELNK